MQHRIPVNELGPQAGNMAHAIEACVHCGFCLPTCPTYVTMGEEMDSPRGRIILMKEVLENAVELEEALPFIDNCLGCVACVTACPSGVAFGELITPFRAFSEERRERSISQRLFRSLIMETLPYPSRFRFLAILGSFARPFRALLPKALRTPLDLLPQTLPKASPLPDFYPAKGSRRGRVALLTGCAQQVLAPNINWATLRVLSENGVEVVIPKSQSCCGALAMHSGEEKRAKKTARKNLSAFRGDFDAVITTAAGCGSGVKEYGLLFKGEAEMKEAGDLAEHTSDVSSYLFRLGLSAPPALPEPVQIVYHDACHLAHAQKERTAPRHLLNETSNLNLLEPPEWELCCGSAGTYNLENPQTADDLGRRKAQNLISTGASAVATGNIGCIAQIQHHFSKRNVAIPVFHTMEILDLAYRGKSIPQAAVGRNQTGRSSHGEEVGIQ